MIFVTEHECKSQRLSNKAPETSTRQATPYARRQPAYIINYIIKTDCLFEQFRSERPRPTSAFRGFGEGSGSTFPSKGCRPRTLGPECRRRCGPA